MMEFIGETATGATFSLCRRFTNRRQRVQRVHTRLICSTDRPVLKPFVAKQRRIMTEGNQMRSRKNNETILTPRQFRFLSSIQHAERCSGAIQEAVEQVSGELTRQHFSRICSSLLARGLVEKRRGSLNKLVFYKITNAGLECLQSYQITVTV